MTEPFLYLMLPTFNRSKTIIRTINSIISQEYPNYRLTIFNDGSSEDYSQVKEIIKDNPKIEYIESANVGVNKSRNIMLDNIRKQDIKNIYFCTISDDDYFTAEAFEIMVKAILKYPDQEWFSFNCKSLSQNLFKNSNYIDEKKLSYRQFRTNYKGDKHFLFKMNQQNIRYPDKYYKNGYEHLLYFSLKSSILTIPHTIKVIEYLEDGLTRSNLYSDMYSMKTIVQHLRIDPFEITYYYWLLKKIVPKKILKIVVDFFNKNKQ